MKFERTLAKTALAALILVMLVFIPVCSPFLGDTAASQSRAPIEKMGDWTVAGTEAFDNQTVLLTGNLTVGTGATLRLTNSSLNMNLSTDRQFHILVKDGGRLQMNGTVVRSTMPRKRYDLEVRNASLDTKDAIISNFTTVVIDHASAAIKSTSLVDNGGTVLSATSSQLDLTAIDIAIQGHKDALDVKDTVVRMASSTLKGIYMPGQYGINASGSSDLDIKASHINDFGIGILFEGRSLTADGIHISSTTGSAYGIKHDKGTSSITNSQFEGQIIGIACGNGSMNVTKSDIKATATAVFIGNCLVRVKNNTISSSQYGIHVYGVRFDITDNYISDNAVGILYDVPTYGTLERNILIGNDKGIIFERANMTLRDCQISSNGTDIQLNGSKVTKVNTTIIKAVLSPTSTLMVDWYLDIAVQDMTGRPVPGANVQLTDQVGTHYNLTADLDGKVRRLQLRERTETRYGSNYNSPYRIDVKNGSATGQATVALSSSRNITITLTKQDLYFKEYTLSNLTTKVGTPVTINITVGSASGPLNGVGLQVLEDGHAYASKNIDMDTALATIVLTYNPASAGTHNLTFILDPDNKFAEVNESNNRLVIPMVVSGSGGGGGGGGGGGSGQPDLVPFGISPDSTLSPIKVTIEVQNAGNANATNVVVALQADNVEVGRRTIAHIDGNSLGRASIDWSGTSGKHTLKVIVDPDNLINESDETNNVLETQVDVSSGLNPNNSFTNAIAMLCIGILVLIVVIIGIVLFFMTRSTKPSTQHQQQYQYNQAYQYPQQGYGAQYYPTAYSYYPPAQPQGPSSYPPGPGGTGTVLCPRCRNTKVRVFDDGHKQCQDCKKIFF